MADDLEQELNALEDAAPITDDAPANGAPGEPGGEPAKGDGDEGGEGGADDWKPPTREHWENIQKAQRAEREARRAAERQARLTEQNVAAIEARVQQWQQQQIAARLNQPPPDPYENPEAARAWQQQQHQLQQQLWSAQQQREQEAVVARQQQAIIQQVEDAVDDYEAEYRSQAPDYDQATDHLRSVQRKILEGMGYAPAAAMQQVDLWALNIAAQAVNAGRNPAQVAYEMAQEMGYVPASKRATANGADRLAAMKAGQAAAQTLSGGGAAKPGGGGLKSILSLEGAAFDSAMEKYLNDVIKGR